MFRRLFSIAPAASLLLSASALVLPVGTCTGAWATPAATLTGRQSTRSTPVSVRRKPIRQARWAPPRTALTPQPPPSVAPTTLPVSAAPSIAPAPPPRNDAAPVPESKPEIARPPAEQAALPFVAASPATPLPWLERWQSDGTSRVVAGSQFRIALAHQVNSRDTTVGHSVTAHLLKNLTLGSSLLAPAGSTVTGTITQVRSARNKLMANISMKRWGKDDGMIAMEFKHIVCPDGKRIAIKASPAPLTLVEDPLKDRASVRVTRKGFVTAAPKGGIKHDITRIAIGGAAMATGPLSPLVGPVANGVLSAASPSYAEKRSPVEQEHSSITRRLTLGMAEGVPGGFLVTSAFRKGDNVVVDIEQPITLELKEDLVIIPPVALGPEILP